MSNNGKPKIARPVIDTGIIILLIATIGYVAYSTNLIQTSIDNFVGEWKSRIKVSNIINNGTRDVIRHEIRDFAKNLSQHRIVTNHTFDEVKEIGNDTKSLIRQLNATNEEERGKAVDRIVNKIDGLARALNVTIDIHNTTQIAELEKQLADLKK